MEQRNDAALLIVGHGSTVNPSSSAPTLRHASSIRARGIFADVGCCFWKEEPSLRDALFFFRDPDGHIWKYCEPVGSHESMTEHLLARAREIAPGVREEEAALLIVAHGTSLNDNSAVAAKEQADRIRGLGRYGEVLNVYMEEPPLVSNWANLTKSENVVVVPFFISDGLHSYEDIPALLGIESGSQDQAHQLGGRTIFYSTAIGTDSRFADVIIEQAATFDQRKQVLQSLP